MADEETKGRRFAHWVQVVSLGATSTLIGLLGWMALQFVAMRDDTHALKGQLETVQAQITDLKDGFDKRLSHVEERVDKLDDDERERSLK